MVYTPPSGGHVTTAFEPTQTEPPENPRSAKGAPSQSKDLQMQKHISMFLQSSNLITLLPCSELEGDHQPGQIEGKMCCWVLVATVDSITPKCYWWTRLEYSDSQNSVLARYWKALIFYYHPPYWFFDWVERRRKPGSKILTCLPLGEKICLEWTRNVHRNPIQRTAPRWQEQKTQRLNLHLHPAFPMVRFMGTRGKRA